MNTVHDRAALRAVVAEWRKAGQRIAFVPTMGNLHAGHIGLVDEARKRADKVVCSVFVNPLQFGAGEDLESYPRTLAADAAKLKAAECDLLFAPAVETIYPDGKQRSTVVDVPALANELCGASRAGHFQGVATVVVKLLNLVQPDIALFGKKDYQQWRLLERCVADLCLPVEVVGIETARAESGLALSSRNGYLSEDELKIAAKIHQTLVGLKRDLEAGDAVQQADIDALLNEATNRLNGMGFATEYIALRHAHRLEIAATENEPAVLLIAARLGSARLIDNIELILPSRC